MKQTSSRIINKKLLVLLTLGLMWMQATHAYRYLQEEYDYEDDEDYDYVTVK